MPPRVSAVDIELRGRTRVWHARAQVVAVGADPDPWDPSLGTVVLTLRVDAPGVPSEALGYVHADPVVAGTALAEQMRYVHRLLQRRARLVVVEPAGRACSGCGRPGTTCFCTGCGRQRYGADEAPCSPDTHERLAGRVAWCPECGRALGSRRGLERFAARPGLRRLAEAWERTAEPPGQAAPEHPAPGAAGEGEPGPLRAGPAEPGARPAMIGTPLRRRVRAPGASPLPASAGVSG